MDTIKREPLTYERLADLLGVSRVTLYNRMDSGRYPYGATPEEIADIEIEDAKNLVARLRAARGNGNE
jgi:predicted site-specific integrase-resolvase